MWTETPDEHVLETLENELSFFINQSSVPRTAHPPLRMKFETILCQVILKKKEIFVTLVYHSKFHFNFIRM